jgi:hypothetical protein
LRWLLLLLLLLLWRGEGEKEWRREEKNCKKKM